MAHKAAVIIAAAALIGSGYFAYTGIINNKTQVRYTLAAAERGTLAVAVSGSGQVSASKQIDLKTKVPGDIVAVNAKSGQRVGAREVIVRIDAGDALNAVRDAKTNLESAKIALEKLKKPADQLSMLQAENAHADAASQIAVSYDKGFSAVADAFLDLPAIMAGLLDILYGTSVNKGQDNIAAYGDMAKIYDADALQFRDEAARNYAAARSAYDQSFLRYRDTPRSAAGTRIEALIRDAYETTKSVSATVKSANDLLGFVKDELTERTLTIPAILTTHQNSLAAFTADSNTHLTALLGASDTIRAAEDSLEEKTESLAKLRSGADALDIEAQELAVRQREAALRDAQDLLADYAIRAPFAGIIGKIDAKTGDSVSSNAAVATLITAEQLAEISLNEIDAAKVAIGQTAMLTFDALPDLKIEGVVAEIDPIGTVTQGVATYTAKISYDAQDAGIKPGMTVSAEITTATKPGVLLVPNSAIKSQGDRHFVEVPLAASGETADAAGALRRGAPAAIERREIQIGASNDEFTEIVSGLAEGDAVIAQTIGAEGQAANGGAPQRNTFRFPGAPGGGGIRLHP